MIGWVFRGVCDRIAKKLNVSLIYVSRKGIKSINQLMQSQLYFVRDKKEINAEDLFLGFDGLKDKYTLVDMCILDSPHWELMHTILREFPIEETDYYKRALRGELDTRGPLNLNDKNLKSMKGKFDKRKNEIEADCYQPIQVYELDNRYYIADGKHRAALCAMLGKKVRCDVISTDYLKDSFRIWILKKMKIINDKNGEFSKHSRFFGVI